MPDPTLVNPSPRPLAATSTKEPQFPYPPRFWWLKRLALGGALLAALLGGVWAAWDAEAPRRLGQALAPVIAAGEAIDAVGMNPPRVQDHENGVLLYRKAWTILDRKAESPANSSIDHSGYPPFPPRWHKLADRAIPANAPSLALAREARQYRRFDWGVRATSPAYAVLLPHLNEARSLANVVGDAALYFHLRGDDAEAVESVRDLLHEARALNGGPTFAVTHLVALGCKSLAVGRLGVIAAGITIEPGHDAPPPDSPHSSPATGPARRAATRAQVRALIADLLDDGPEVEGLRRVYAGERAAQLDTVDWLGRIVPVLRPMFRLDGVGVVRLNDALLRSASQPTISAARGVLKGDPFLRRIGPPQTNLFNALSGRGGAAVVAKRAPVDYTRLVTTDVCALTGASAGRVMESNLRVRADARLAAASLAIQLYRADHAGAFPPSLDALVPDYLPRVPQDPLSTGGEPIRYVVAKGALPGGGDRPLVYSVGTDGVDNTAADLKSLPKHPSFGTQKAPDELRDVSRWVPVPSPEEQKQEEEQEREAAAAATRPAK